MNAPDHFTDRQPEREPCRLPVSNHFPPLIRDRLVAAAATPFDDWDPLARVRAVDQAIVWARLRFPNLFRSQNEVI